MLWPKKKVRIKQDQVGYIGKHNFGQNIDFKNNLKFKFKEFTRIWL